MIALAYADRVKETSTSTGTGNLTLDGADNSFVAFNAAYGLNRRFPYTINGTTDWEVGTGYLSDATTLVRETVLASSNAGALVAFSAGSKDVFSTLPAGLVQTLLPRGRVIAAAIRQALS